MLLPLDQGRCTGENTKMRQNWLAKQVTTATSNLIHAQGLYFSSQDSQKNFKTTDNLEFHVGVFGSHKLPKNLSHQS